MLSHVHEVSRELRGILLFVAVIWVVFLADMLLPLEQLGLIPRTLRGLPGIAASPFPHANLSHLVSNTIPLLVLLMLLAGSRSDSTAVVVSIVLLGGGLLWLFRRDARHIGASGLVFGLIAFLLVSGVLWSDGGRRCWPRCWWACFTAPRYSPGCCPSSRVSPGTDTCSGRWPVQRRRGGWRGGMAGNR